MNYAHCFWIPLLTVNAIGLNAHAAPVGGVLVPLAPIEKPANAPPALNIQPPTPPAAAPESPADRLKIVLQRLQIDGAEVFPVDDLLRTSGFVAGNAYSLNDLRQMASRIERYYKDQGYPVARAYLPAQNVREGAVRIQVAEGRYGQVLVRNQSQVSANLLSDMLQDLRTGDRVNTPELESALLLLSDLPGVQVKSGLVPGATAGTSDLMIDVLPTQRVSGSIDADNAGNYYTGEARVGATVFLNEPTGEGDVASLRLLTSGEGLNYMRAAYQLQMGQARVGTAYSHMEYALGQSFQNLLANGTASSMGFFGSYPLERSRDSNASLNASYDSKRFEDRLDSVSFINEKNLHLWSASVTGDLRDSLAHGGLNTYAVTLTSGHVNYQSASALDFDTRNGNSQGRFHKLTYNLSRQQSLGTAWALFVGLNGQSASKNLDASEKIRLGGMAGVRAFPESEGYGDEGHVLNLEARWTMPSAWAPAQGQWQLVGFVDTGHIKVNKNPWNSDANQRTLSGAGVAVNWTSSRKFTLRMAYAQKLGSEVATAAPDRKGRVWLHGVKEF